MFIGDATSDDDSRAMIAAAVERYGGLHVLVNDLGFGGRSVNWGAARGLTDLEESTWNWAMDLNLRSAMLASKHAVAPMTAAGGGSIHQHVVGGRAGGVDELLHPVRGVEGRTRDFDQGHGSVARPCGDPPPTVSRRVTSTRHLRRTWSLSCASDAGASCRCAARARRETWPGPPYSWPAMSRAGSRVS